MVELASNGSCSHRASKSSRSPVNSLVSRCIVGTSFDVYGFVKKASFVVLFFQKSVFQKPLKKMALTNTSRVELSSDSEIDVHIDNV